MASSGFQKTAFVVLLILQVGVAFGWLGGL
ncbi:hypothetical protein SAMN05421853_10168 [Roseivivax halotolerans]|jgi:hypothetical protein|uniref:Uncharacterized protein n=1 Tax=Roseivivax halotolerans TaxID=93684 RepID=A0A1I5UMX3_9RHOB|nr:hypothetical protein FIU91_16540 [Roseivivax sp. THAF30]SFP96585.1 hypothetical protein SAMN05421853_10168 [Roseivivax halotolerans]